MVSLPEALKPIAFLSGRWSTKEGQGIIQNIPSFTFHDVLEFSCVGQPMFNYTSISKHPLKQTVLHQEKGFLRIKPNTNILAFVLSHNFGLSSIEEGHCNEETNEIVLETVSLARTSFSKPPAVRKFKRILKLLSPQKLQLELFIETDTLPMSLHLTAIYTKVDD